MDLKCPGSSESHRNRWENLDHLTERDEVKFVVQDRVDYQWACDIIRELDRRVEEGSLGTWILEDQLPVRLQVQLHKLIWGPDRQGV